MLIPATVLAAVTERFAVVSSHSGSIRSDSPSVPQLGSKTCGCSGDHYSYEGSSGAAARLGIKK